MKNHELLDMIGEVNEDYVLEAGNNVARPRFSRKTLAACAACAALVLAAYPVYRAAHPPLHGYTVVEGGGMLDTQGEIKTPGGGGGNPVPDGAYVGDDVGPDALTGQDDIGYDVPITEDERSDAPGKYQDAPVQEAAAAQYDNFMKNAGLAGAADCLPEWCGGLWIDNDRYPEARLTVAVVKGFRTAELEAQIREWCGGEVVFKDVKYSWSYLDKLMHPIVDILDGRVTSAGFGVNVTENCLDVDIYGDAVPDEVLTELARLDPAGDAIRVRVFSGGLAIAEEEQQVRGPAIVEQLPLVKPDANEHGIVEDFHPDYDPTVEDGLPANHDVIPERE